MYRHRIAVKGILWNVAYSVGAHAALNTAALNTAEYIVHLLSILWIVAFCGMLLSIQNTALCCFQYSVSLHFIQDVIQIIGECNSKTTCEVVSWVWSSHAYSADRSRYILALSFGFQ